MFQVDSGLKEDLVFGDPNAPRFVLWNGKLRPVPSKPNDLPFFDLMSFPGKLRAGFGAIGIRPPPPVCPLDSFHASFSSLFAVVNKNNCINCSDVVAFAKYFRVTKSR